MMKQVVRLDIQYWFGYIAKNYTDQMIGIFNDSLRLQSKQRLIIRQFDAMKCNEVGAAVQRFKLHHNFNRLINREVLQNT